jgi:hypothetical protein
MGQDQVASGYSLRADVMSFVPHQRATWTFEVLGPNGRPRSYRVQHERELHLIIVRNDIATFSHLHPSRGDDGRWTVDLSFSLPGSYTAFADIAPEDASPITLKLGLEVEGEWEPQPLPAVSKESTTDGYAVSMHGNVIGGEASEIAFQVTKDGARVKPDPYLGAAGHLVALRAGDLEYLHVHPMGTGSHGAIGFMIHAPGLGTYRLFLQFLHDGAVRTAGFTVDAARRGSANHSEPHAHF